MKSKRSLPVLPSLHIPNPCEESWRQMKGDSVTRHCNRCDHKVHNLSAMSQQQATALLDQSCGGKVCVRYMKDSRGDVVFLPDLPLHRRVLKHASMILGICLTFFLQACGCATKGSGTILGEIPIQGEINHRLLPQSIYFAFDSDALDARAKTELDRTAEWIHETKPESVTLEGHCDERGTDEYNMVLGAQRARATYNYLRLKGVDPSKMTTLSYGEDMPDDPRHNEEAWSKNRRVEIKER